MAEKRRTSRSNSKLSANKSSMNKKKSPNANRSKKDVQPNKDNELSALIHDILITMVFVCYLLVFLATLNLLDGGLARFVSNLLFGLMGYLAYFLPWVAAVVTLFSMANRGNKTLKVYIWAGFFFVLFVCMILTLSTAEGIVANPVQAFHDSREGHSGGGMVGSAICWIFIKLIGKIGAYIMALAFLAISLMLFYGKAFIHELQDKHYFFRFLDDGDGDYVKPARKKHSTERAQSIDIPEFVEKGREARPARRSDRKVGQTFIIPNVGPEGQAVSAEAAEAEAFENQVTDPLKELRERKNVMNPQNAETEAAESAGVQVPNAQRSSSRSRRNSAGNTSEKHTSGGNTAGQRTTASHAKMEEISDVEIETYPEEPYAEEGYPTDDAAESYPVEASAGAEKQAAEEMQPAKRSRKLSAEEKQKGIDETQLVINLNDQAAEVRRYEYPDVSLLNPVRNQQGGPSNENLYGVAEKLQKTLHDFNVDAKVTDFSCGPAVTRFEITPATGVKVSKIVGLADDIKLNLAVSDIRIEAPIPGKSAVGIEVPNEQSTMVSFRELVESAEFVNTQSKLSFVLGKDIGGKVKVTDIARMPHLLIAGATGSGKSVCINTIIMSILYKASPDEVKMIMIDPKVVELSVYNGIPHLLIPVVTDPKKAANALAWAVSEMTDRYNKFAEFHVRDIKGYNAKLEKMEYPEGQEKPKALPLLVVIVDELADLMMVASKDVEESICRLAQLARAAGIHLIIATQRPSVNVITGLIKANMPSRIAFAVTSGIDSRTILDMNGAEKLLGKGDMLFSPQGAPKPMRVQGAFVSDEEVAKVTDWVKEQNGFVTMTNNEIENKVNSMQTGNTTVSISGDADDGRDPYFAEAGKIITDKEKASIGMLQRYLKVGFNRAARIMDQLEDAGVVGPDEGTKPRAVLMSPEQFENYLEQNG